MQSVERTEPALSLNIFEDRVLIEAARLYCQATEHEQDADLDQLELMTQIAEREPQPKTVIKVPEDTTGGYLELLANTTENYAQILALEIEAAKAGPEHTIPRTLSMQHEIAQNMAAQFAVEHALLEAQGV